MGNKEYKSMSPGMVGTLDNLILESVHNLLPLISSPSFACTDFADFDIKVYVHDNGEWESDIRLGDYERTEFGGRIYDSPPYYDFMIPDFPMWRDAKTYRHVANILEKLAQVIPKLGIAEDYTKFDFKVNSTSCSLTCHGSYSYKRTCVVLPRTSKFVSVVMPVTKRNPKFEMVNKVMLTMVCEKNSRPVYTDEEEDSALNKIIIEHGAKYFESALACVNYLRDNPAVAKAYYKGGKDFYVNRVLGQRNW